MKKQTTALTNDIINIGVKRGLLHLNASSKNYDGRQLSVNDHHMLNFGSYSYLGLENDHRLKQGAINAILNHGIQYPSSRAYVSGGLYEELESKLSTIFGAPAIIAPSTALIHQSTIPIIIEEGDAVILDQQVHSSVQDVVHKLKLRGIPVEIVRHNNLEQLEQLVSQLSRKHRNVWYFIDGVYSMYGDVAPIQKLNDLQLLYPQLHLYIDDAHGMSWAGEHGKGYALSKIALHERMILATSLNKAFAAGGGVVVLPNLAWKEKVRNCGGPLIFSGQLQNSALGAGIACADIHLSPEIYNLQDQLMEKIVYCDSLLHALQVPMISNGDTPIFFIPVGLPRVGYNLVQRMHQEGFLVNLAVFPAVPEACTGVRFTITNHLNKVDIKRMATLLGEHFLGAMSEEGRTISDLDKAFKRVPHRPFIIPEGQDSQKNTSNALRLEVKETILDVAPELWDTLFAQKGWYSHHGMQLLESVFSNNKLEEHNWKFYYVTIYDEIGKPVLVTVFTEVLSKDDLLAPSDVSKKLESKRVSAPYYLTSKVLLMGTPITEGQHLMFNNSDISNKRAMKLLLDWVENIREERNLNSVILRDFDANDSRVMEYFIDQGFIRVALPQTNIMENPGYKDMNDYLSNALNYKKRYKLKKEVLAYEDKFDVIWQKGAGDFDTWFELYESVKSQNFEINDFKLPPSFFKAMAMSEDFEVCELYLKPENDTRKKRKPVAVVFCFTGHVLAPVLIGIDYDYASIFNVYKQAIYQVIKKAIGENKSSVYFGMTAEETKKKFGVKQHPVSAYVSASDHYNYQVIDAVPNIEEIKEMIS